MSKVNRKDKKVNDPKDAVQKQKDVLCRSCFHFLKIRP